jgi:GxxExxY protein
MEGKLIYGDLTYLIRGILYSVQNELGNYRNEKQYGDAFEFKLKENNIKYEREKVLDISFEGEQKGRNRIDFIIEDKIIIELKCLPCFSKESYFQCMRYLVSTNLKLALLVNFRPKSLIIKRIINHQFRDNIG